MDRRGLLIRGAVLSVPLIASAVLPGSEAAASTVSPPTLTEFASSSTVVLGPYSVAFSPDFNALTGAGLIAVASYTNNALVVFSYYEKTLSFKASSAVGNPASVAFSSDFDASMGAGLIGVASNVDTNGMYGSVVVFSYAAGTRTLVEKASSQSGLSAYGPGSVAFSPHFSASMGTGVIAVADENTGLVVFSYTAAGGLAQEASSGSAVGSAFSVAFSPDFKTSGVGLIGVADNIGHLVVFSYTAAPSALVEKTRSSVLSPNWVAFSPDFSVSDGTGLIGVTSAGTTKDTGLLVVFSYTTNSLTSLASSTGLNSPFSVAFSPDFKASGVGLIGIVTADSLVVFSYEPHTLTELTSSTSGLTAPYAAAFSPEFSVSDETGLIGVANNGTGTGSDTGSVVVFSYTS